MFQFLFTAFWSLVVTPRSVPSLFGVDLYDVSLWDIVFGWFPSAEPWFVLPSPAHKPFGLWVPTAVSTWSSTFVWWLVRFVRSVLAGYPPSVSLWVVFLCLWSSLLSWAMAWFLSVAEQQLKMLASAALSLAVEVFWFPVDCCSLVLGSWLGGVGYDGSNQVVSVRGQFFRLGKQVVRGPSVSVRWLVLYPLLWVGLPFAVNRPWVSLSGGEACGVLVSGCVRPVGLEFFRFSFGTTAFFTLAVFLVSLRFARQPTVGVASRRDLLLGMMDKDPKERTVAVRALEACARGKALATMEGVALVAACGSAGAVPRLRARGLLACRLQSALGGPHGCASRFLAGRWVPDLPSSDRGPMVNSLLAIQRSGVKVLGVGTVPTATGVDGDYVLVESQEGERRLVLPSLHSQLAQYATFRSRDPALLEGLRSRAVRWFKEVECPSWVPLLCLPSSIADAFSVSAMEAQAAARIGELGGVSALASF